MSWLSLRASVAGGLTFAFLGMTGPALGQEAGSGEEMFSISVDGEHVAGTAVTGGSAGKAPGELGTADIQVKYDGLGGKPILNAATIESRRSFMPFAPSVSTISAP